MSVKNPPAFPANAVDRGMTLRDYFAGQQLEKIAMGFPNEAERNRIAANCYAMADAMLKARGGDQ